MTIFRTCHTCASPAATCPTRETLQAALAGLRITSVKHRCADYRPAFEPGDAVKVLTLPFYPTDDEPHAPKLWFPGHFIQIAGTRALVFVKPGARSLDSDYGGNEYEFEPHARGYLKVPLSRVAHRDGEAADVEACRHCAAILSVGDICGRDPNYTPLAQCLAIQRAALSAEPGDHIVGEQPTRAAQVDGAWSREANLTSLRDSQLRMEARR